MKRKLIKSKRYVPFTIDRELVDGCPLYQHPAKYTCLSCQFSGGVIGTKDIICKKGDNK